MFEVKTDASLCTNNDQRKEEKKEVIFEMRNIQIKVHRALISSSLLNGVKLKVIARDICTKLVASTQEYFKYAQNKTGHT